MKLNEAIESLHPGNFAMVMATGIISIGLNYLHFEALSKVFAFITFSAWIILLVLCGFRLYKFSKAIITDLTSPRMVFSYFTLVAATDIIGMLAYDWGYINFALSCWFIAFFSWCLLLYLAFQY